MVLDARAVPAPSGPLVKDCGPRASDALIHHNAELRPGTDKAPYPLAAPFAPRREGVLNEVPVTQPATSGKSFGGADLELGPVY